jgi:hypothetical protein
MVQYRFGIEQRKKSIGRSIPWFGIIRTADDIATHTSISQIQKLSLGLAQKRNALFSNYKNSAWAINTDSVLQNIKKVLDDRLAASAL